MKPTFQNNRQSRHLNSERSASHVSKSPATDWSFQSGADLRGATAVAHRVTEQLSSTGSIYAVTHGLFEAQTKWEERIEGFGLMVVIALAAWPLALALQLALDITNP